MIIINNVTLIGRLTKDVDLRQTQQGTSVGTFNIAVNRPFKNQQGEREADFIRCVIWREAANNLAKYTNKGSQVGIEGRIQTRTYDDQQGQRQYITEIVVNQFHLIEPKNSGNNGAQQQTNMNNQYQGKNTQNAPQYDYGRPDHEKLEGQQVNISEQDLPF